MAGEPLTAAEKLARRQQLELVQAAVGKQNRGEKLSRRELKALADYEAAQDAERGGRFVRRVPKAVYSHWAGDRQTKILHDQAKLYGLPLVGKTIDVPAVIRWLHDWLADNKHELAAIAKGDAGPQGGRGELLAKQIENLEHRNRRLEQQLAEADGALLPRDVIHDQLQRLAGLLRKANAQLDKRFGNEAGDVLRDAIDDFQRTLRDSVEDAAGEAAE